MYLGGRQFWPSEDAYDGADISPITSDSRFRDMSIVAIGPMFRTTDPCFLIINNYLLGLERLAECPEYGASKKFIDELSMLLRKKNSCSSLADDMAGFSDSPGNGLEGEVLSALRIVASSMRPPR